jgi:hypothetical protein
MINKIKDLYQKIAHYFTHGFSLPLMRDPLTSRASLTAMYSYVSFWLAFASVISFIKNQISLSAVSAAIVFWVLATVFHKFRRIDYIKVDIDDKSLELGSGNKTSPAKESAPSKSPSPDNPDA